MNNLAWFLFFEEYCNVNGAGFDQYVWFFCGYSFSVKTGWSFVLFSVKIYFFWTIIVQNSKNTRPNKKPFFSHFRPFSRLFCKTTLYLSKHKKSGDTFTIFDTMESLSPSGFDYERKDSTQRRLYSALINLNTEVWFFKIFYLRNSLWWFY